MSGVSPTTGSGVVSIVKVQVDDDESPQFSRLANLAGVTPPIPEADLIAAEQQKILRAASKRERLLTTPGWGGGSKCRMAPHGKI